MVGFGFLWIAIALFLWAHFKLTHKGPVYMIDGPPQQTFLGSLMWPFYLIGYFWGCINRFLGH